MLFLALISALLLINLSCTEQKSAEAEKSAETPAENAALTKADPSGVYGAELTQTETTPISAILADPEKYQGQRVLVSGTIVDICPMRGCWIDLAGDQEYQTIRVKVKDGEIVFPLSARGKEAQVEGVVERIELSVAQARKMKLHEAEEKGETIDTTQINEPMTIWRIKGIGAIIQG